MKESLELNELCSKCRETLVYLQNEIRRNSINLRSLSGEIDGLREGSFSCHTIGTPVQRDSSTVIRVWKKLTDEHRTTRKTCSGRQWVKVSLTPCHVVWQHIL
ncbi:hypothetical protein TNCV_1195291 [Trichonephila clavipes]|nr:hypothetical protein TNCV_1195291 [Trichonephila clavipes]